MHSTGLGGGMGMFLSGPIIAELSAAPDATDPLAAGRRVLEVVVPLSYRPALKVNAVQSKTNSSGVQL